MRITSVNDKKEEITLCMNRSECIKMYFLEDEEKRREISKYLKSQFLGRNGEQYGILIGYIDERYHGLPEEAAKALKVGSSAELTCMAAWKNRNIHMFVLKSEKNLDQCIARFEHFLDKKDADWMNKMVWSYRRFEGLDGGYAAFWEVYNSLKFGISLGGDGIICGFEEGDISHEDYAYPIELERQIGKAVGSCNESEYREKVRYFLGEVLYSGYGQEIVRFSLWRLIEHISEIVKSIDPRAHGELRKMNAIKRIFDVVTREQVEDLFDEIGSKVCRNQELLNNYNVNRALEHIRLHFNEGVNLQETARLLDITPEYLSGLFKKEIGINFSVFLKRFRISQAKRMLKSTDMKVYEVAAACGYSNSNYFIKVFHEVTGVSPKEFR